MVRPRFNLQEIISYNKLLSTSKLQIIRKKAENCINTKTLAGIRKKLIEHEDI